MKSLRNILLIFSALTVAFYFTAIAQDFNTALKVRFIKIFPKYVEWPANKKSGDFVIGIVGDANLATTLSTAMASRMVGSQPIIVKQLGSAAESDKCHIVYLSASKSGEINTAVSKGKKNSTLILTDKVGLISKSQINFVFVDSKLKFELNVKNLTNFGLKFNDQLKSVAAKVIE